MLNSNRIFPISIVLGGDILVFVKSFFVKAYIFEMRP